MTYSGLHRQSRTMGMGLEGGKDMKLLDAIAFLFFFFFFHNVCFRTVRIAHVSASV